MRMDAAGGELRWEWGGEEQEVLGVGRWRSGRRDRARPANAVGDGRGGGKGRRVRVRWWARWHTRASGGQRAVGAATVVGEDGEVSTRGSAGCLSSEIGSGLDQVGSRVIMSTGSRLCRVS